MNGESASSANAEFVGRRLSDFGERFALAANCELNGYNKNMAVPTVSGIIWFGQRKHNNCYAFIYFGSQTV